MCVHARASWESDADSDDVCMCVCLCVCVFVHEIAVGEFGADGDGSQEEFRQVGGQRIFEELRVPADAFRAIQ